MKDIDQVHFLDPKQTIRVGEYISAVGRVLVGGGK